MLISPCFNRILTLFGRIVGMIVIVGDHIVILDGVDRIPIVPGSILVVFDFFLDNVDTGCVRIRPVHVPSLFIMELAVGETRTEN